MENEITTIEPAWVWDTEYFLTVITDFVMKVVNKIVDWTDRFDVAN